MQKHFAILGQHLLIILSEEKIIFHKPKALMVRETCAVVVCHVVSPPWLCDSDPPGFGSAAVSTTK